MIKQEKKREILTKNKILWKEKVDFKKHRIKLLQMKNVIEIKNSKVRIHINKTKLKWKYLNGREIKKTPQTTAKTDETGTMKMRLRESKVKEEGSRYV